MEKKEFADFAELMQFLREHADSVDYVRIPIADVSVGSPATGPVGGVLRMCSGFDRVVNVETMQRLLQDGIFSRLETPIRLEVQGKG